MEFLVTLSKFFVGFIFTLVFLIGALTVCNYQIQIVQGQGMQLIPQAVAQEYGGY